MPFAKCRNKAQRSINSLQVPPSSRRPIFEHIDCVAVADSGKPVGDHHDRPIFRFCVYALEDSLLGHAVYRASGFIEDQHVGLVV